MKVGTDGVLLGAAVSLAPEDRHVLDAGTGTGVIALMLAQRYGEPRPCITGIDIDDPAAAEAAHNFAASPWAGALRAEHCSLAAFAPAHPLDLIVSNPPFFERSLLPPLPGRGVARHTAGEAMSFAELAQYAQEHLSERGRLAVILPAEQELQTLRYAASCGLYPFRIMRIRTTPRKPVTRFVAEFSRARANNLSEETLVIQDPAAYPGVRNGYTPEYLRLTGDFYLD